VRHYVDGLRTNTVAMTATGGWSIYRWDWQFSGSQALDEAYVPFFGAFGAAWDDAMVARWSANPLGMLWLGRDAAVMSAGGGHHRWKPKRERTAPGSYGPRRRISASTGARCYVT
jgi:hypothetical protein